MFLEWIKLIVIGNYYRFIGKNIDLYERRYVSCKDCPFNSKNSKLSFRQKSWQVLVGDFCTKCSCPLKSKLVAPLSECPELKWGQEL